MTTREAVRRSAIARLTEAGIDTAVLDADLLVAHVIGARQEDVYAHPEAPLTEWAVREVAALVERRVRGEPVAYLRGMKEFYGLSMVVDQRVLIPRPETEVLVQEAVRWGASREAPLFCDLGTGSGAVAVAIAVELPRAHLIAIDASEEAIALARENALRHDVLGRIDFRAGDLLAPLDTPVDAVVANLPYLRTEEVEGARGNSLAFEPRVSLDGGADGLRVIRRAIEALPPRLAPEGAAFFECAPDQAGEVSRLLGSALGARVTVSRDLAGFERVVAAQR
jgi:release factor glutamine methyltransferase